MLEVLPPGVEDGQEADLRPEVLRVGGDLPQGLGDGAEEQAVDRPRVLQRDRSQRRREREDHVEVVDGQQFGSPVLHPFRGGAGLTLGAVAIAARVIRDPPMPAPVACLDMPAQGRGPAGRDVAQGAPLLRRERAAIPVEEGIAMSPNDLGHLEPRPGHGRASPGRGASRSRGLGVVSNVAGATWV